MPTTSPPAVARRGAFTLVEIMIAVSIIVLMLALALPAFRAITGSRSTEGATNIISSMLSRARTDAVGGGQPYGVAFFYDGTGQYKLAEVAPVTFSTWAGYTTSYLPSAYVSYTPVGGGALEYFVSLKAVPASTSNSTPDMDATDWQQYVAGTPEYYWAAASTSTTPVLYDQVPSTDAVLLPTGVGAQVVMDSSTLNASAASDRYLRAGLVMFDASGRVAYQSTVCSKYGIVGSAVGLDLKNATASAGGTAAQTATAQLLPSSFGVVVYDRDAFGNQNFPVHDPTLDTSVTYGTVGASPPSEADAEAWLDVNATPLLINRYTGELVHGE